MIEVARASIFCSASTSFRFSACDTRRTMASASGEVTRRPSMVCLAMPAEDSSASSWGPAPWTTIGVSPTCCRNASEDVSACRSSRNTAPPTLTTAKRLASSWEKRFKYCEISFALAILESSRTMVWRRSLCACMAADSSIADTVINDVHVALCNLLQLGQFHPFVRAMRLSDITGAADDGCITDLRKQRSFGPEIDRIADRQADLIGKIARGQTPCFGVGSIARRQRRTAEGLLEFGRLGIKPTAEHRQQRVGIHRRQRAKSETNLGRWRNHIRLDPAFDTADIETQAGQPAETLMRLRLHMIERALAPANCL